jgi:transcriptional antiterminator
VHNFLRQKSGGRVTINPQLEDMKNASPFVFCMAKIIVAQLAELAKKNFTEDDAAYLSVHIGLALQKQLNRNCDAKIECGLLITPYFDYDISLKEKLLKIFGDDIKIVAESQTETDLAQLKKAQLIFSTVPLENNFSTDWVIINPLLTTKNIGEISQQILCKRLENRKKVLRRFLAEQTFFENISPEILNPDSWGIFGDIALQIKFSDEVRKLTLTVYRAINPSDWKNCRVKIFLDFETPVSCWDFALFIVDNLTEYLHEISAKKKTETFFGL